jgi:hypothetical protein
MSISKLPLQHRRQPWFHLLKGPGNLRQSDVSSGIERFLDDDKIKDVLIRYLLI